MKTIEQFKDYCTREMNPDLAVLEKIRMALQGKLIAAGVLGTAIAMAVLYWLQMKGAVVGMKATLIVAGVMLIICLVTVAVLYRYLAREYFTAYRMSVIDKFIRFIDEKLQYEPFGFVSGGLYSIANLFRQQAERYSGSDLAKGRIGDVPVEFSNVHSEHLVRTNKGKHWQTIFKGLFFVGCSDKNFSYQTIILPDTAQNLLGKFGQMLQSFMPPVGQLVKFGDCEFEKYFVVYSENENQARQIVSEGLMDKAVKFRARHRSSWLRLSFSGPQVFIALSCPRNLCEPTLFGPVVNFSKLEQYLECISFAVGVVEELNTNNQKVTIREIPIGHGSAALI